jgi:hypothetical protein
MPKRPNAKKIASRQYQNSKTLEAAASEGKYLLARVEKSLGFCQFSAVLQTPSGLRPVTVLIRGKFKGGRSSDCYVEPGVYVLAEGDPSKTMEVVGVVNRQKALETLRRAGRVSERLVDGPAEDDDLFERSEAPAAAADIWAKRDEEREALAEDLVARYKRREALGARRIQAEADRKVAEAALAAAAALEADDEEPAEAAVAAPEAPSKKPITSARRLRALQLAAEAAAAEERAAREAEEAEAAAWRARIAALDAAERAEAEEEARLAVAAAEFRNRPMAKSWEDEVDIDAI